MTDGVSLETSVGQPDERASELVVIGCKGAAMKGTAKENLLRVIHHDGPAWVPNGMESVVRIGSPAVERPSAAEMTMSP